MSSQLTTARLVLTSGLLLVALLLDVTVLGWWTWPGFPPDLMLMVVVTSGLLSGPRAGAGVGMAAGLLADFAPPSPGVFGVTAIAYALGGLVAARRHRLGERSVLGTVEAAASAALLVTLSLSAIGIGVGMYSSGDVLIGVLSAMVSCAVGSLLLVPFMLRFNRWTDGDLREMARR